MATQHFGPLLRVGGTADFRDQIVQAAVHARLAVQFEDLLLEHRRKTQLEQGSAQIGGRYKADAVGRQHSARGGLDGNEQTGAENAARIRRGCGGHRHGP